MSSNVHRKDVIFVSFTDNGMTAKIVHFFHMIPVSSGNKVHRRSDMNDLFIAK